MIEVLQVPSVSTPGAGRWAHNPQVTASRGQEKSNKEVFRGLGKQAGVDISLQGQGPKVTFMKSFINKGSENLSYSWGWAGH